MKTQENTNRWNITRIVVGHDSNYGQIHQPSVLISALQHFHDTEISRQHASLVADRDALRKALERLVNEARKSSDFHPSLRSGIALVEAEAALASSAK